MSLVNESTVSVVRSGVKDDTSDISLSNVLCLPKFPFYLVLVSKKTKGHNCGVFFSFLVIVFYKIF